MATTRHAWWRLGAALIALLTVQLIIAGCDETDRPARVPDDDARLPGRFYPHPPRAPRELPDRSADASQRFPRPMLFFEEHRLTATVHDDRVDVSVLFYNSRAEPITGTLGVTLTSLDGEALDSTEVEFQTTGYDLRSLTLQGLPADLQVPEMVGYNLEYEIHFERSNGQSAKIVGLRSLFEALRQMELQVLTAARHAAGEPGFARMMVRDPNTGAPIVDAEVAVELHWEDEHGEMQSLPLATGRTDNLGTMAGELPFPVDHQGPVRLVFAVHDGEVWDTAEVEVALQVDARVLLVTDKPLYQPGQTMHLRALALDRARRTPLSERAVIFEISDAAGNKVMREQIVTDSFGIAATTFELARQVNMGEFRITAALDEEEVKKQVTVERYTLPNFGITLTLDRSYYLPGQRVEGTIAADYFFGQPVAGGKFVIQAAAFDVEFTTFAELQGTLNQEGLYHFSFELPDYLVGTSLEQGNALIKIDVVVTDLADHEQSISRTTVVAQSGVDVTLLPESGVLIPGVANRVYVVVGNPMGTPLPDAHVAISIPGRDFVVPLDEQGIGRFILTPAALPLEASLTVTPPDGAPVEIPLTLEGRVGRTILLRTDQALYQVGDTLQAEVLMAAARGRVFVDVIHGGRTVLTQALDVVDGHAQWSFELDPALSGALRLNAYYLGENSEIVRDARLVYVEAADGLRVKLTPDREVYAPGEPARVAVETTDSEGRPKVAALGVQVVDEAVFALQEAQPGLLKVYFELEEALGTPGYQFAWPSLRPEEVIESDGSPDSGESITAARAARAEVAFAAQEGGHEAYGATKNTRRERVAAAHKILQPLMEEVVAGFVMELRQQDFPYGEAQALRAHLAATELFDFWGRPYRLVERPDLVITDQWGYSPEDNIVWEMISDGPDKRPGTADDLSATFSLYDLWWGRGWDEDGIWFGEDDDGAAPGGGGPPAEPDSGSEEGPGGVRVRSYFPETLHVEPALITDSDGRAEISLTMADSITEWRMSALGNTLDGLLGSTTAGLTVFQDFFVDIDFPATLTRGDEVSVPIAIYNYLDIPQTVRLEAQSAEWLELLDGSEVTVPLDPGQVTAVYFDVRVKKVGTHALTIFAEGTAMSDAVRRTVLVKPDGRRFEQSASRRFRADQPADAPASETIVETVSIPHDLIEGSATLLVKVYPGMMSQAVEGLDSMLRLPQGCLEQTTSSAWPNVLVMAYMKAAETLNPEVELKAQQYVNLGYQRILTFECRDGGFNWWVGDNPGNAVLSALVIMMLDDTSAVQFVDSKVITRTQDWLASVQQSNGSWTEERHLHAGNENLGGSSLRATSYIAWGLAQTGYDGSALGLALQFIESRLPTEDDIYTIAMAVNALSAAGRSSAVVNQALTRLYEARIEEPGGLVHWQPNGDTMVGSWGNAAAIETTALVGLALMNAHAYPIVVEGAVNWLIGEKDPQGNWGHSTQATVLTLKLLLGALGGDAGHTEAEIHVRLNGAEVGRRQFDNFNRDVMWQLDLSPQTVSGDNELELSYEGVGNLMYQVVASYHLPWAAAGEPAQGPVTIEVEYDKTTLAVDDTVTVNVTVTNHDPSLRGMMLVDLGRPPAFHLHTEDLAALREASVISEYEFTDRQILIYLDPLEAGVPLEFSYRLTARYPISATVPGSSAAPYYDAAERSETDEFGIEVQ